MLYLYYIISLLIIMYKHYIKELLLDARVTALILDEFSCIFFTLLLWHYRQCLTSLQTRMNLFGSVLMSEIRMNLFYLSQPSLDFISKALNI